VPIYNNSLTWGMADCMYNAVGEMSHLVKGSIFYQDNAIAQCQAASAHSSRLFL